MNARTAKKAARKGVKRVLDTATGGSFSSKRLQEIPKDYQIKDLLLDKDGNVPLLWFTYTTNYGDLISQWLFEQMTAKTVVLASKSEPNYIAVGSILKHISPTSIVWGTGSFGNERPDEYCAEADYRAVRGPLTRRHLAYKDIKVPAVYGDPALLMPLYYQPDVKKTYEVGVVIRWSENKWRDADIGPGVRVIDLASGDIEEVTDQILSCKRIISSSLHGLIIADAYDIPNAWIDSGSPNGGDFKFYDYFITVNKLREARRIQLDKGQVTVARLKKAFDFDGRAIEFNYRKLLDACPFLERKQKA